MKKGTGNFVTVQVKGDDHDAAKMRKIAELP